MVTLEQYKEATCARRRRDYFALTALLLCSPIMSWGSQAHAQSTSESMRVPSGSFSRASARG